MIFSASGIDHKVDATSVHNDWQAYTDWVEGDTVFVLLTSDPSKKRRTGIPIPRRLFQSPADLEKARQFFAAFIGNGSQKFPPV
jgi:hypothetical protein